MDDAAIVQIGHAGADAVNPRERLLRRQAGGAIGQHGLQARVGHVFHDHPGVALLVLADVVEIEQVRVFQIEALADAAQFDVEIPPDQFQGDVLAGVAGGVVDFAEAALADAALDRVAAQGARTAGVDKPAGRRFFGAGGSGLLRQRVLIERFQGRHLWL